MEPGIAIGEVLGGKYRVDAILGHGGMGVVARCTHLGLDEQVAIKMLRRDVLDDYDAVERFGREAQAAAKLRSEYVARVTDVGRFENGVPYMIMEYLEGHDLGQLIDERGAFALQWSIELMLQACEALAEAHALGIVHRDIKPSNLFVTWRPDGSAILKVLDFGISKAPYGTDMNLTQTQSLLGTPAYMSPEQMRSARQVDIRSDIWSLGTVMYELLEGRRPFEAETFSEMCVKVAVDAPAPMEKTPPQLQPVVLRCLAKVPDERYATMADLGRDLAPFAPDVHAANLLVERMSRVHRRSLGGMNAVPAPVSEPALSGEAGSPSRAPALPTRSPAGPLPRREAPRPDLAKLDPERAIPTLDEPRKKRRFGIIVVAGVLALSTGVALYLIGREQTDEVVAPPPAPIVTPAPRPMPLTPLPAKPDPTPPPPTVVEEVKQPAKKPERARTVLPNLHIRPDTEKAPVTQPKVDQCGDPFGSAHAGDECRKPKP